MVVDAGRKRRDPKPGSLILALSLAHDKSRQLPAYRPERVEELLWDWACNWPDLDIKKVMEELKQLFHEQEVEERRKQAVSGNE